MTLHKAFSSPADCAQSICAFVKSAILNCVNIYYCLTTNPMGWYLTPLPPKKPHKFFLLYTHCSLSICVLVKFMILKWCKYFYSVFHAVIFSVCLPSHHQKKKEKNSIFCIEIIFKWFYFVYCYHSKKKKLYIEIRKGFILNQYLFIFMAPSLLILFRVKEVTDSVCEHRISSMNKWLHRI